MSEACVPGEDTHVELQDRADLARAPRAADVRRGRDVPHRRGRVAVLCKEPFSGIENAITSGGETIYVFADHHTQITLTQSSGIV